MCPWERSGVPERSSLKQTGETHMGKAALLWLIGIPLPVILLLWIFFFR